MVFLWAGMMHPISLLIFWLWIGTRFEMASVDRLPDLRLWHSPLLTAGSLTAVAGAGLSSLIYIYWNTCVRATSVAGAAQAATAAVGVVLIGAALFYAGMPRGRRAAA
jgi:ACS family hexuronate transporter-like MFS transporter